MRLRKIILFKIIISLIILSVLFNVFYVSYKGEKGIAERKAREFFFWRYIPLTIFPYGVQVSQASDVNTSILKDYNVYRASGYIGWVHPPLAHSIIAVKQEKSFHLPDELNKLILEEGIAIQTEDVAFEFAKTYIKSSGGAGGIKVLQNVSDLIPPLPKDLKEEKKREYEKFIKEKEEKLRKFSDIIKPPEIREQSGEYFISLYSWIDLGGHIDKWFFIINRDGLKDVKKERIASEIGFYWMLK